MMNPAITSTFDTPAKVLFLRNGDVHRIPYGAKRELTIRLAAVDLTQISGSRRRAACNMEPISFFRPSFRPCLWPMERGKAA